MTIDFIQRVKLRLKGMGPYRSAPVTLMSETEALIVELGGAINAISGDVAELRDALARIKDTLDRNKPRPSRICDPEVPNARDDWA